MKTICLLILSSFMLFQTAYASSKEDTSNKITVTLPADGSAYNEPKDDKWTHLLENKLGKYFYDESSLDFVKTKDGLTNHQVVGVDILSVFLDPETISTLNKKYEKKLKKQDSVHSCTLHMVFDIKKNMYRTTKINVLSKKDKVLEDKVVEQKFLIVPKETFAEVMLNIAKDYFAGII